MVAVVEEVIQIKVGMTNPYRLIKITDRALDVVFSRFRGFSLTNNPDKEAHSRRRTGSFFFL